MDVPGHLLYRHSLSSLPSPVLLAMSEEWLCNENIQELAKMFMALVSFNWMILNFYSIFWLIQKYCINHFGLLQPISLPTILVHLYIQHDSLLKDGTCSNRHFQGSRTNNVPKCWHGYMNHTLKKTSNNLYKWVEALKEEALKNDTDCKKTGSTYQF